MQCSHPNQIRGADGMMWRLTCGQPVETVEVSNIRGETREVVIGVEEVPEKKPEKRTRYKTSSDLA